MSKRLFNLRNVPADEADDIRELLQREGLDWYETPPSPWGISHGALWLRDAAQWPRGKALLDDYQRQRGERTRGEHEEKKSEGQVHPSSIGAEPPPLNRTGRLRQPTLNTRRLDLTALISDHALSSRNEFSVWPAATTQEAQADNGKDDRNRPRDDQLVCRGIDGR